MNTNNCYVNLTLWDGRPVSILTTSPIMTAFYIRKYPRTKSTVSLEPKNPEVITPINAGDEYYTRVIKYWHANRSENE